MKWYSAIVYAIGIAFSVALALFPKTAPAQHQTYQGIGVVCDEPEQVARYVRAKEGDGALAAINAEKPNSCAIMKVAFFMGETREKIATSSGTWQITKILIVGVDIGQGIQEVVPTVQWSAFPEFPVEGEVGA
jgi:hypothetical protein